MPRTTKMRSIFGPGECMAATVDSNGVEFQMGGVVSPLYVRNDGPKNAKVADPTSGSPSWTSVPAGQRVTWAHNKPDVWCDLDSGGSGSTAAVTLEEMESGGCGGSES